MATNRIRHDVESSGMERFTWAPNGGRPSRDELVEFRVMRYPKGHFGIRVVVRGWKYDPAVTLDQPEVSKLIEALQELNMYPPQPEPYRRAPLPEAFIGELGLYYPARMSEITALEQRGLIERDEEEDEIDGVPVWRPVDPEDGEQVKPEQIEAALAELRARK